VVGVGAGARGDGLAAVVGEDLAQLVGEQLRAGPRAGGAEQIEREADGGGFHQAVSGQLSAISEEGRVLSWLTAER
jgi:hypothetical protein